MRSHHCNALRPRNKGETVVLVGWINTIRDQGGVIFVDLRDREGITQCVFRTEASPEAAQLSHKLRSEDVIQVTGTCEMRLSTGEVDTTNANLETGEVEIIVSDLKIINKADVLPFPLDKEISNEDLRIKYRYLDLRRPRMARNLQTRHRITKSTRDFLDNEGFIEVETPILSKSTPEGARDFLIPSRLQAGDFYALPQAPQQYKQLLMVAGVERYFQIAKCFRDEDLRADRQPEFTQIDVEASFVEQEDILSLVEGLMGKVFLEARSVQITRPFDRMTYQDAMNQYGSDKPDRRFEMKMIDLTDTFAECEFKVFSGTIKAGGVVKAINAKGYADISSGQIDTLTKLAQEQGAKGLAYIQVRGEERSTWRSPFVKRLTDAELEEMRVRLNIEPGDLILFAADQWLPACEVLGKIRLEVAELRALLKDNTELDFLWITEFPLLHYSEEEDRWHAMHHPFTRPLLEDEEKLRNGELKEVRAQAYDIVLNGHEIGGGSMRIHEASLQEAMFDAIGVTKEQQVEMFSHILDAFRFGAPPHGGFALGLDRLAMLVCGEKSIREVMAFPKNNKGVDLMTNSPTQVDTTQLRDLRIKTIAKKEPKGE